MSDRLKNIILVCVSVVFFLGFGLWAWFKPAADASVSERRPLAQMPAFSVTDVMSGKYTAKLGDYAVDQFPLRDTFRSIKTFFASSVLQNRDVNKIYLEDGYASKLEYPLNESSIDYALKVFRSVYDKYLSKEGIHVYFSLIPDKNYFLAEENGYPVLDYERMTDRFVEGLDYMTYLPIYDCLELEDYYTTDTHWRQEAILPVAEKLLAGMGSSVTENGASEAGSLEKKLLDNPFYGVYYGQSALPLPAEELYYMTNETLENCVVFDFESNKEIGIYDMEKAYGNDPYEIYLSGPKSLQTITNPANTSGKRLIVFRDSFGSAIAPLMVEEYSEIVLIDIRYLASALLGQYVNFENSDVLFLYSTLVLNNATTLK